MNVDIIVVTGLVCTVGSFVIAWLVFGRSKAKDDKAEGASIATITSDMGYIKSSVDGIDKKLEKQADKHIELLERVCDVEASAKSAHKRIDDIVEKEK
jgi:uncharacterized protein YlxW (UPF0749 family)